jgi:hypothetical protein
LLAKRLHLGERSPFDAGAFTRRALGPHRIVLFFEHALDFLLLIWVEVE